MASHGDGVLPLIAEKTPQAGSRLGQLDICDYDPIMAPWLRVLEAYMVQALLRTPAFHRAVEKVVRSVNRFRHGLPPEEMGGTKIDTPNDGSFLKHFTEEIQTQLGRAEAKTGGHAVKTESSAARATRGEAEQKVEDEGADAVWEKSKPTAGSEDAGPKQGFMGVYIGALREQLRGGK